MPSAPAGTAGDRCRSALAGSAPEGGRHRLDADGIGRKLERNVALLVGLRHDTLVPRASFFAMEQARKCRRRGFPQLVIAHEDVVVLRKP